MGSVPITMEIWNLEMKNSSKLVLTPKFWALIDKDPNLVKEYRAIPSRVFLILMTMILLVLMSPSWYLPSSLQDLNPSKKINTNRAQPPQFRNKPQSIPVPTQAPTTTTTTTTRRTTTRRPTPTTTFAPAAAIITTEAQELNTEFNTEAPEILSDKLVDIIDTIEEVDGDNPNRPQPAVVKAGEDYYYYYYYYDDDETLPDEDA